MSQIESDTFIDCSETSGNTSSNKQEKDYHGELYSLFESFQIATSKLRLLSMAEENILKTISKCLKNWHEPWKRTFLEGGREFKVVYDLMEGLLHYEYQITTNDSVLSRSRIDAIEQAVIRLVDYGNAILNIDLVIRVGDDSSNEMDPFNVTTIELYQAHLKANDLRKKLLIDYNFKRDKSCYIANSGGDTDTSSASYIMNGSHVSITTNLQVPNPTLIPSPTNDKSLARTPVGSSTSINTITSDFGHKVSMSANPPSQLQIEVRVNNSDALSKTSDLQLEIIHMTATIKSPTFSAPQNSTTRLTLLPGILTKIGNLLSVPANREKTIDCFALLDVLLVSIEKLPSEFRSKEVNMISMSLLKPIVRKVYIDDRDNYVEFQNAHWTTCLLSIVRLMTASDFNNYLRQFSRADLSAFLKDFLFIVKRIISASEQQANSSARQADIEPTSNQGGTYPDYWIEMKLLASSVFLNSLTYLYQILRQYFASNLQTWMSFIDSLIHFILQDTLRSDRIMLKERQRLLADDLRQTSAEYIWISWDSLSLEQKQQLPEDLVEPLLRACMILNSRQRSILLPIFYDMMRCDYTSQYISARGSSDGSSGSTLQSRRDFNDDINYSGGYVRNLQQSFKHSLPEIQDTVKTNESLPYLSYGTESEDGTVLTRFTHLIIGKLNTLMIDLGLGDECFKNELCGAISGHLNPKYYDKNSMSVSSDSGQFKSMAQHTSDLIAEFMQICLDCHEANKSYHKHIYLLCLFKLILFFKDKVDRAELYLTNLYKLCRLHHTAGRYVEAGYTLLEHAKTLQWSDRSLENHHRIIKKVFSPPEPLTDYSSLKIFLYDTIIEYFDQGQIWEAALPLCRELVNYYEFKTFDYEKVANLMQKMSIYFTRIVDMSCRSNAEYFRVTFYGSGFPRSIRGTTMVYRGKPFEKLGDFQKTMLDKYPDSKLLNSLSKPSKDLIDKPAARYLQINACSPVVDLKTKFGSNLPKIEESILNYYRHNECDKFNFSRRIMRPSAVGQREKINGDNNKPANNCDDNFANMWRERTTLTTNTLPGMLPFFPVYLMEISVVSPIESAIEDLERTNDRLSCMVNRFKADKRQVEDVRLLGQLLLGIVDAAVNGGIAKYEEAFFTASPPPMAQVSQENSTYKQQPPNGADSINHVIALLRDGSHGDKDGEADDGGCGEKLNEAQVDRLKHLIAQQVPLLDDAIRLHSDRVADVMRPQHEHLEASYKKLKYHIMTKYYRYLPADYTVRPHTMRSYRSLARSPNRSIRSESRLPFTGGGSARFANKRMSDTDSKSNIVPSALSVEYHDSSHPATDTNIPYKQLGDVTSERRSLPFLTGVSMADPIRSRVVTHFCSQTSPLSAPQSSSSRIYDSARPPVPSIRTNLLKIGCSQVNSAYTTVTNNYRAAETEQIQQQLYTRLIGDERCDDEKQSDDDSDERSLTSPDEIVDEPQHKQEDGEAKLVLL